MCIRDSPDGDVPPPDREQEAVRSRERAPRPGRLPPERHPGPAVGMAVYSTLGGVRGWLAAILWRARSRLYGQLR